MPRTCRTCQASYGDEQRGLCVCSNCGELLPPPTTTLETARGTAAENDWPYRVNNEDWSTQQPITQNISQPPPARVMPDEPYLSQPDQSKSPALAALLSFLLVGMGQVYLGQVEKGLTMLGTVLLLMLTVRLGSLGFVILLFNVLDAFLLAKKIEEGRPILRWEFFFNRNVIR